MNSLISLREPVSEDGFRVFNLIKACPPLDQNSAYCNLIQCTHFSETSVIAEKSGEAVGFISGHIIPKQNDTLFIWQVAVSSTARGEGLGKRMMKHILDRHACAKVRYMETTITEDNEASWAMFKSLARDLGAQTQSSAFFDKEKHFDGQHESEILLRIGPF